MSHRLVEKIIKKGLERYRVGGVSGLIRSVTGRIRHRATETKWPQHDQREVDAILEVLRGRKWGGAPYPGKYASRFAESFARLQGVKHGICCNSGTTALLVALKAAGIGRGDEVLIPGLTFAATATVALEVGATPVFVDIDPETWCIDHRLIAEKVSPRTKAIVPVHLGCRMADMDEIGRLAEEFGLKVIEDAAHMHGGKWRDRGAGSLGDLGCFSFENTKLMTAGEGGIVLTNDDDLAARCHAYVNLGRLPETMQAQSILGSNLRMTEFQAAILTVQLQRLREQIETRARNYALFDQLLADIDGVAPLKCDDRVTRYSGYGYYFKYLPERCGGVPRDRFLMDLEGSGILSTSGWKPVYHSPEFGWRVNSVQSNYSEVACPVAEKAAYEQAIWMLHHKFLAQEEELRRMGRVIASLVAKYQKQGVVGQAAPATTDQRA